MAAPAIKFCGLTRPEDAAIAAALGACYLGTIFASGPRLVTPERAAAVYAGAGGAGARRVGVFGSQPAEAIADVADAAGLDGVQLHGDPDPAAVARVRERTTRDVWAVLRVEGGELDAGHLADLLVAADAVVLDAKVAGALGGTGVALAWHALRAGVDRARDRAGGTLVLAGGLTPENVARAAAELAPDVVDVSSGVERSPGVKDHDRMRAFALAARGTNA